MALRLGDLNVPEAVQVRIPMLVRLPLERGLWLDSGRTGSPDGGFADSHELHRLALESAVALAARLLAPVLALAPERRDALLGILRAWLGENGSWDATAKATGLHRNSIRRQIGMLAELLELDLNQAQARAELWIALQYTDELPRISAAPAGPAGPDSSAGQLPQDR